MMNGPGEEHTSGFLLDTNILVAFVRGGAPGACIDRTYQLSSAVYKPLICIVSVGECLALARKFSRGTAKTDALWHLLRELVWIDINDRRGLQAYAELDRLSEGSGQTVGKNDLWIAATASVTGATLLSTDRHFEQFAEQGKISLAWIDPRHGASGSSAAT